MAPYVGFPYVIQVDIEFTAALFYESSRGIIAIQNLPEAILIKLTVSTVLSSCATHGIRVEVCIQVCEHGLVQMVCKHHLNRDSANMTDELVSCLTQRDELN